MAKLIEKIKDKRAPEPETPARRDIPVVHPAPEQGLTSAQVRERTDAGWTNAPVDPPGKTVKQIVLSNIFTYFNMLFFLLALCVIAVQQWLNLTFMGVIIVNTAIGIVQELRSKKTLDKLSILASPKAVAVRDGKRVTVDTAQLVRDDIVVFAAGNQIYADAVVAQDSCYVNEALITGESDEIKKNPGDKLLSGSFVVSGLCRAQLTDVGADSYVSRLTQEAKRAKKPQQSEMMRALQNLVKWIGVIVIPLGVVMFIKEFVWLDRAAPIAVTSTVGSIIGMIPEGLYLLTSLALVAGVVRLAQRKTLVHELGCIETAGDIDTLLLDKTGTITIGNRKATRFHPADGIAPKAFVRMCVLSSVADPTPEGKSVVELGAAEGVRTDPVTMVGVRMVKFTAETKCSGVDMPDGRRIRKGAAEAIFRIAAEHENPCPAGIAATVRTISENGGTPLVVCENERITGVIELQDIIKTGIRERFERLRRMGVKTVMVTGDNPLTAKYIAEKAGVDDFIAEARPEDKLEYIRREQQSGKLVAMMGDGTNDAPALAQADVGVAMNSGTQAAKEAGNMVDLDNDPTKLIEIVEIGKQLLMTRGTLTTFSIANDVAKYFAIVPALFIASIPSLGALNVMHLHSPESAILSAVIFNALIIPLLIPLALRGVTYKPIGASALLRRNLFIYGLGGVIVPFVGIKLIDMLISVFF